MDNELYRKKSLEKVTSPETLNDYVRVTNPGIWLLLTAIVVLLLGACVWGIFGYVDTRVTTDAAFINGTASVNVADPRVKPGMEATVDDSIAGLVTGVSAVAGEQETLYQVSVTADVLDGNHTVVIVTERVHPFSFVLN